MNKQTVKTKVTCPQCNEEVWDTANGYKLNKCWNCMLAFDSVEELTA